MAGCSTRFTCVAEARRMHLAPPEPMPHQKHPDLRVLNEAPFNAGPPPALQRGCTVTPTALFFARSHGTLPEIDPSRWRLTVGGLVDRRLELSLAELRGQFACHAVTSTLVCAGLRRDELLAVRAIPGEL